MRDKTLRTIGATAVLVGIAIAALAQIGNEDPGTPELAAPMDSSVSSQQTVDSSRATTTTSESFEYRVGLLSAVTAHNYWEFIGSQPTAWNTYVLGLTKSALFGVDPVTGALTPDLAASGPAEPVSDEDGWWIEVPLRTDRHWSDGSPITAVDIVYTFHIVRRLGLEGGWANAFPSDVAEMRAGPGNAVRIEFTQRPSLSTWPYGVGLGPIMPSKAWGPLTGGVEEATQLYQLDGSAGLSGGPVAIESMTSTEVRAVTKDGTRVTYVVFDSETSAVEALTADRIDTILSPGGLSRQSAEQLSEIPAVTLESSPSNSVRYLGFNLRREPMASLEFRQALALILDRPGITASLVPDATPASSVLSPFNRRWYDEDHAGELPDYGAGGLAERMSRALSLLGDAGYSWATPPSVAGEEVVPGTGLLIKGIPPAALTILTSGDEYDPARPEYAAAIEAALEGLGFDVRSVITDFDTVVDLAFNDSDDGGRQFDMYLLGWTLGNPALPDFYGQLFATEAPANSTGYSDDAFETVLKEYQQAVTVDDALSALWGMERRLAETLPYLVLYHPSIVEAYRNDRVAFGIHGSLGGLQARLGGIEDVSPAQ